MSLQETRQPDSGLIARTLEDAPKCLVAAPSYLARAGTQANLQELTQHSCLAFQLPRTTPWVFCSGEETVEWLPPSTMTVSEDVLGVASLAEQGMGFCQLYDFVVQERIREGRLVEVLPELRGHVYRFSLIYPPHRRLSAASKAMIEILTETAD